MPPAFGFSAGDFITAINLIRKISKALKETGGASTEYQNTVIELKGLKHALQHLEALKPTDDNLSHINAIRGMALACQLPLQDFMIKLEKYEATLGPWESPSSFRAAGRKTRWAVSFAAEVEKLRAVVAAKQLSLNLLLATNSSQTLSKMNSRTTRENGNLMLKVAELRATVSQVQIQVDHLKDSVIGEGKATRARLDAVSSDTNATRESLISLGTLAEQMTGYIRTIPQNVREALAAPMQSNWQIYQILLQIQQTISRVPTSTHASNIRFTNALGEYRELPYEYFDHWEPFEGFLRSQFKGKPGENKVLSGQFHMIDTNKDERVIVKKEHWSHYLSEGSSFGMSMIMSHLQRKAGSCPRPDCPGSGTAYSCERAKLLTCELCRLNFFPALDELEGSFGHVSVLEDDEEIARKQVTEDLQLYGSRPEPLDAINFNKSSELAGTLSPPSQSTAGSQLAVNHLVKVRKEYDIKPQTYQAVTAFDWNSGTTPLESWLNQSAIPSASPTYMSEGKEDILMMKDPVAQEIEEMKVFRNVHMSVAQDLSIDAMTTEEVDQVAKLELDAQIYYRNIVDRYPGLPLYLTLRLARANCDRAHRFRRNKGFQSTVQVSLPLNAIDSPPLRSTGLYPSKASQKKYKCEMCGKKFIRSSSLDTHMYTHSGEKPYRCSFQGCERMFSVESNLRRHRKVHRGETSYIDASPSKNYTTVAEDRKPYSGQDVADSDFWSSRRTPRRRGSVHSRSSSMNSSLRGDAAFDPEEQDPTFYDHHSRSSSADFGERSRGLPPPPVELHQSTFCECDICGINIRMDRRRDWQKHVLEDLRPYICTSEECQSSTGTYASRKEYIQHEIREHKYAQKQYACIYCSDRFKHKNALERHQNVEHFRKYSWSCAALHKCYRGVFLSSSLLTGDGVCDYCGVNFPRKSFCDDHLEDVHKFGQCNQEKFFRADHFRRHLKHSHAGTIGPWMCKLETACMREEPTPVPEVKEVLVQQSKMDLGKSTECLFCGQNLQDMEGSRRRHIERHMEEIAFAVVSKPYKEWDFYSDSSSNHTAGFESG